MDWLRERRVRARLLIRMLACRVEMHMRKLPAPLLFDDEDGPVRESPVAKAERSLRARWKAATKRTRSGKVVHDFRGPLRHLGPLAMSRIEPSEPDKRGFDLPSSPAPILDQALRLLNAKIAGHRLPRRMCPEAAQPESRNVPDIQTVVRKTPAELPDKVTDAGRLPVGSRRKPRAGRAGRASRPRSI